MSLTIYSDGSFMILLEDDIYRLKDRLKEISKKENLYNIGKFVYNCCKNNNYIGYMKDKMKNYDKIVVNIEEYDLIESIFNEQKH
jgi:hypothetical protein